jgi:ABC-type lipoprotein release transport system permease subunit
VSNAAVLAVAGSELRRRWRALVAIGVLAGFVGAALIGALTIARRTGTAPDRLARANHIEDARVSIFGNHDLTALAITRDAVAQHWVARYGVGQLQGPNVTYLGVLAGPAHVKDLFTPLVIRGRAANPAAPDEILLGEAVAGAMRVRPGDTITLKMLTPEEVSQFETGFGEPDGPLLHLRITGIVRLPGGDNQAPVIATPAFTAAYGDVIAAGEMAFFRLKGGRASLPEFRAEMEEAARRTSQPSDTPADFAPYQIVDTLGSERAAKTTARVLVAGLLVFALVVAIAGLLAVTQAFGRLSAAGTADQRIESTLGLTTVERVLARVLPGIVAAGAAAVLTAAGAVVAGRFEPLGALRSSEPNPGWHVNAGLTVGGAVVMAAVVLWITAMTVWLVGRSPATGRERAGRGLSRLGRRASTVAGARFALDPGRGATRVPIRSSLAGVVVGVAGLVAACTFAGSLDRLVASPVRWGWKADFAVIDIKPATVDELLADRRVGALVIEDSTTIRVRGDEVAAYAFTPRKGDLGWTVLTGRTPQSSDEVLVGTRLAEQLGAGVGDIVPVDAPSGPNRLKVVGIGVGPVMNNERFGSAMVVTPSGLAALGSSQPFHEGFVAVAPGVDASRFADELAARHELARRQRPADVGNLAELGRLPYVLAGFLAFVALVALAHTVGVTVRRRARDFGVLRAIGFSPRQAAATVVAMAVTIALLGMAGGVPLGIAVGRLVWWDVARNAGVAGDPSIPLRLVAALVVAVLAGAGLAAAVPARRAVRLRPAEVLRAE